MARVWWRDSRLQVVEAVAENGEKRLGGGEDGGGWEREGRAFCRSCHLTLYPMAGVYHAWGTRLLLLLPASATGLRASALGPADSPIYDYNKCMWCSYVHRLDKGTTSLLR